MIIFLTGVPGSGKTLRTMYHLAQPEFADREVYSNIAADTETGIPQGHLPLPDDWRDVPDGSVVVVDEAQHKFPQRGPSKPVPEQVSAMDTHRHRGVDFILTTQRPTGVDHHVRGLVGLHEHLERKSGLKRSLIIRKNEAFDPKDAWARRSADTEIWKFPNKFYGSYKSAELHTATQNKVRIPNKVKVGGALIGVLALLVGWKGIETYQNFGTDEPTNTVGAQLDKKEEEKGDRVASTAQGVAESTGFRRAGGEKECTMKGPPYYCHTRRYDHAQYDNIAGCVQSGDYCVCFRPGSPKPIRDGDMCRAWISEHG